MMIKNSLLNEKLNRRLFFKETPQILNKFFHYFFKEPKNLSAERIFFWKQFRAYLLYANQKILCNSPFAKVRTICFLTGRNRSVYRSFHLSRIKLREFAAIGSFSGLSKASW